MPRTIVFAALLVASVACAAADSTDASSDRSLNGTGKAPGDTSTTSPYLGNTSTSGFVLTMSKKAPSTPGGSDTLQTSPVSGAELTLYHNVLQNGAGVSVFVATTTSAANGAYSFAPVPGGYYIIRSGGDGKWTAGVSYLYANSAAVTQNIYVAAAK
jgi:hypothetical protein